MLGPKKVAIVGAGPAGLVTAKTLLHSFPAGTFAPTVFEKRAELGGLWPSSRSAGGSYYGGAGRRDRTAAGPVSPSMRTNLSRFTVAFSDFAWESVLAGDGVPMFPQAWQVGLYLEKYAERYIPAAMIRLRCAVVGTVRAGTRWTVRSVQEQNPGKVMSEEFDYLVVASGYFSAPYTPDIPGLSDFKERTAHSSALDSPEALDSILPETGTGNTGKLVVVGGSMSGAEAASALAFHLSSAKHTPSSRPLDGYTVHHVFSKPFWTLPTYLPQGAPDESPDETVSFQPLDLVMYNLDRRPPGPVQYSFGPLSAERIHKTNSFFHSMLGDDYETHGYFACRRSGHDPETPQPTWVGISNDYAEFVRSRAIHPTPGRVCAVNRSPTGQANTSIDITLSSGQKTTLDNVAAVITATGYTPHSALSFLPADVLATLEYLPTDPYLPLILDGKGSARAEIANIGFVGFYKGPYWGAMEMQARLLGQTWAAGTETLTLSDPEKSKRAEEERNAIRDFRNAEPGLFRAQLPMGDYTGLMESFARELGIERVRVDDGPAGQGSGPVVPARYSYAFDKSTRLGSGYVAGQDEIETTLDSLRDTLNHNPNPNRTSPATAMAIFRALHGQWRFTRLYYPHDNNTTQSKPEQEVSGTGTFHPRYPTRTGCEKEYLYEETEDAPSGLHAGSRSSRAVYRLLGPQARPDESHFRVQGLTEDGLEEEREDVRLVPARRRHTDTSAGAGAYVVSGRSQGREYVFYLEGVAIRAWESRVGGIQTRFARY